MLRYPYRGLTRLAEFYRVSQLSIDEEIVRRVGEEAQSEHIFEELIQTFPGYVYRGMTFTEYNATIGSGKPILSNLSFSHGSEGTSFSEDPGTAESYVNFGRDDPRKTDIPTYLVEVEVTESMYLDIDGYMKDKNSVPLSNVKSVWEFSPDEEGNLWMRRIQ